MSLLAANASLRTKRHDTAAAAAASSAAYRLLCGTVRLVVTPPSLRHPPASSYPSTPSGQHGNSSRQMGVLTSPLGFIAASTSKLSSHKSAGVGSARAGGGMVP